MDDMSQAILTTCAVAPDGQATGNGSTVPINLATLVSIAATMWPGVTINLAAGQYGSVVLTLSGNPQSRIFLSASGRAILGALTVSTDYLEFRGIEFCSTAWTDRGVSNPGASQSVSVGAGGNHVRFVNCIFHDLGTGLIADLLTQDCEFYGCLFYYCGYNSNQGHGLYLGNRTGRKRIEDCIFWANFSYNLHGYSEQEGNLKGIDVIGCTSICAGLPLGLYQVNLFLGGAGQCVVEDCILTDNMSYHKDALHGGAGLRLGFGTAGSRNCQIVDNYIIGGAHALSLQNPQGNTVTGNTFAGALQFVTSSAYPDNTYIADATVIGDCFFLLANKYDVRLANLTIYNQAQAETVAVDVSSVYQDGDVINVHNVEDYFTDIQILTVAGGQVVVNMQAENRTVATPQGWTAPATTFPRFGCFRLERQ